MKTPFFTIAILLTLIRCAFAQDLVDPNLRVDLYAKGLASPTGMVFLPGTSDALITQKNDGKVRIMHQRKIVGTALDLPVANASEEGLLSIALSPDFATSKQVYLYHTVAKSDGGAALSNTISRYTWNGSRLAFDKTIINLPGGPGPNHDGGKIVFSKSGQLLAVIGDLNRKEKTQNFENSNTLNRVGGIIRIDPDGGVVASNPFAGGARTAVDDMFAYGIRNSFGLTIDPVTGNLWDTENGPDRMDEINHIKAGFNSGWRDIMGPVSRNGGTTGTLVSLGAKAAYSDPEFSWADTVAPTDLHFFEGSRLGDNYRNDLFVGDVNTGTIFHFDLNSDRTALVLGGALADRVADNTIGKLDEQDGIIFGNDFGVVTDLLNGPGGLFALSLSKGKLYRIREDVSVSALPSSLSLKSMTLLPEPGMAMFIIIGAAGLLLRRRHLDNPARR